MATLEEMDAALRAGLRDVQGPALTEVASLRTKYPTAFTDEEHALLAIIETAREKLERNLARLHERLQATRRL